MTVNCNKSAIPLLVRKSTQRKLPANCLHFRLKSHCVEFQEKQRIEQTGHIFSDNTNYSKNAIF